MEYSHFIKQVSKVKKIDSDVAQAHQEMMPSTREKRVRNSDFKKDTALNAGVMALFYPNHKNETMLVLILRKTYKGVHSGQIGFPGGREENQDEDIMDTALRETYEEVGVRPSNIEVIRPLEKIYIPPSNFWVYPFLGICKKRPRFKRQESEVEELILVKLEDLMCKDNLVTEVLTTSYVEDLEVPAFSLNRKIIWGATGMMLNEVKYLLQKVL